MDSLVVAFGVRGDQPQRMAMRLWVIGRQA
jgi:hypothetical protein